MGSLVIILGRRGWRGAGSRDLIFVAEPAAEVDELAALAAKWKNTAGAISLLFIDFAFADGAAHDEILDSKSQISDIPSFFLWRFWRGFRF